MKTFLFKKQKHTVYKTKSFKILLNELDKYPVLSRQDEYALFDEYRAGSEAAKEKLINYNLRFVVTAAADACTRAEDVEDAFQDGCIGLKTAVERFDHTKGFKLISYAVWWIRQAIFEGLLNSKVVAQKHTTSTDNKALEMLKEGLNDYDITTTLGITQNALNILKVCKVNIESMNAPTTINNEDSGIAYVDTFRGDMRLPDDIEEQSEMQREIGQALDKLDATEAKAIKMLYGIGYEINYSTVDIYKELGFNTRQALDNRLRKAMKHLRIILKNKNLRQN
jgi:RNA polymerase primary sigma factor